VSITIIGIDCATQPGRVGLARGVFEGGAGCIEELVLSSSAGSLLDTLLRWVGTRLSTLLALDAPLGWPGKMGVALSGHQAGVGIVSAQSPLINNITSRRAQ
jgi:predicted RNase H-like nuclease